MYYDYCRKFVSKLANITFGDLELPTKAFCEIVDSIECFTNINFICSKKIFLMDLYLISFGCSKCFNFFLFHHVGSLTSSYYHCGIHHNMNC